MRDVLKRITSFTDRLVKDEFIADGKKEGYHGSGPAVEIDYSVPAATRSIRMLLSGSYKASERDQGSCGNGRWSCPCRKS